MMRLEAVQTVMMTVHHRLPAGMSFSRSSSCLYIEVKGMIVCFSLLLTRGGCLLPAGSVQVSSPAQKLSGRSSRSLRMTPQGRTSLSFRGEQYFSLGASYQLCKLTCFTQCSITCFRIQRVQPLMSPDRNPYGAKEQRL